MYTQTGTIPRELSTATNVTPSWHVGNLKTDPICKICARSFITTPLISPSASPSPSLLDADMPCYATAINLLRGMEIKTLKQQSSRL